MANTLRGFLRCEVPGYLGAWCFPRVVISAIGLRAGIAGLVSVLLYASMATGARDEQLNVHPPMMWSSGAPATVIVRPVPLLQLAEILD